MKRFVLVFWIIFLLASCISSCTAPTPEATIVLSPVPTKQATPPDVDEARIEIIVRAIQKNFGIQPVYPIDSAAITSSFVDFVDLKAESFPELQSSTLENFIDNRKPGIVVEPFPVPYKNTFPLVNRDDYLQPLYCVERPCIDLEQLNEDYPGAKGVFQISPVAFNDDATQALFYFEIDRGVSDYEGYFVLLEYEDGEWKVIRNRKVQWVS